MKFLFDLFPVLLFFIAFKWGEGHAAAAHGLISRYLSGIISGGMVVENQAPIIFATVIAILATVIQIAWLLVRKKKVDAMLWVSLAVIAVLGGATIYFHNDTFIMWKPTVLYWIFGAALFVSQTVFGSNLIRTAMQEQITLPDPIWRGLGLTWAAFFIGMGLLNLYVAYHFSTSVWVNFKLFGAMGLMFVFVIAQSVYLSKYAKDSA